MSTLHHCQRVIVLLVHWDAFSYLPRATFALRLCRESLLPLRHGLGTKRTPVVLDALYDESSVRRAAFSNLSQWLSLTHVSIAAFGSPSLNKARTASSPSPTDSNIVPRSASPAAPCGRASTSSCRLSYSSSLTISRNQEHVIVISLCVGLFVRSPSRAHLISRSSWRTCTARCVGADL